MRGKVDIDRKLTDAERITPAYAGKSVLETRHDFTEKGSPPPMRGKDIIIHTVAIVVGITPAYAGKSKGLYLHVDVTRDHPRLCGEKKPSSHATTKKRGSPPPMRGKVELPKN